MQSTSRDLSSGSEPRPEQVNEQRDTAEISGRGASGVPSVGCTSESGAEKVLLFIHGDISIPHRHSFYLTNS